MLYRLISEREIDVVKLKQSIYRHDSGMCGRKVIAVPFQDFLL